MINTGMKINEIISAATMYFLCDTNDPEGDLQRGFSCHIDGWTDDYAWAVEKAKTKSLIGRPLQDPKSKRWCFDPERGLSGFAFHDLMSLEEAMRRITSYVGERDRVAVFQSSEYDLGAGADGEDVFSSGRLMGFTPFSQSQIAQLTSINM